MNYAKRIFDLRLLFGALLILASCGDPVPAVEPEVVLEQKAQPKLFTELSPDYTKVGFKNVLAWENERVNPFIFINAFSGGGVSIGDVNNDGLSDIYLTGNTVYNRLFINTGKMQFVDVTEQAGVNGGEGWSAGVTMADVNGDGLLDIYVSRGYDFAEDERRANILYVNNGDMTFTDRASEYGIADIGLSVQSTFFDYDRDGDLDLYVGNQPWEFTVDQVNSEKHMRNPLMRNSDHLYRNDGNGKFVDVTKSAGILNYGFILGLVVGDYDQDGWPDIYVAIDHVEPDKLYKNNGDGTFTNVIDDAMKHTCKFAMGIDMADFNNDGLLDIFNVDMMAEDNYREKSQMAGMAPDDFWYLVGAGYGYQYMRNVLQLNNGNGTFSDIGQFAGVHRTDWSWAALFADFDNDGQKDIYVTNGMRLNIKDNDFLIEIKRINSERVARGEKLLSRKEWSALSKEKLSSTRIPNYYYENNGDFTFTNKAEEYGLGKPGFSNGAAYGDLDNDGDLDIVVNNLDDVASMYQNNAAEISGNNALRVRFIGEGDNKYGLGGKITLKVGDQIQYQELTMTRGFQSSVEYALNFGLGKENLVDELKVEWPDGKVQILKNVEANQYLYVFYKDAVQPETLQKPDSRYLTELTPQQGADFRHKENDYNDYDKEVLLPHKMSQFGPGLAVGDANGDGLEDFYVGGAAGQSGALFVKGTGTNFIKRSGPWESDRSQEDLGAAFFDADGDGDNDLYVVSGGNAFEAQSHLYQDRLYINNGQGNYTRAAEALPVMRASGSCVVPGDFDGDGDLDLFVGGRVLPATYPFPPRSYILKNDAGKFSDVTESVAPALVNAGMVTSAIWTDFNADEALDLVVVGEWMPIGFFENQDGRFTDVTASVGTNNITGWWNKVIATDLDNDGDEDLVVGNLGLNYKYKASQNEPLQIYGHDFDDNGSSDIVLGYFNDGICFPVRGRQCSSQQMPSIKVKFTTYDAYARASLLDIYGPALDEALHYQATTFSSMIYYNMGGGRFKPQQLPAEAQFSSVNAIVANDFNRDGIQDLLLAGNLLTSEVETGCADAGIGYMLLGKRDGGYQVVSVEKSGVYADGDVKDMRIVGLNENNPVIVVANNDDRLQVFKINSVDQIQ